MNKAFVTHGAHLLSSLKVWSSHVPTPCCMGCRLGWGSFYDMKLMIRDPGDGNLMPNAQIFGSVCALYWWVMRQVRVPASPHFMVVIDSCSDGSLMEFQFILFQGLHFGDNFFCSVITFLGHEPVVFFIHRTCLVPISKKNRKIYKYMQLSHKQHSIWKRR